MLGQKHGKIINIASMYAFVGSSYVPQVSYAASKAAILGLTKELAVEWGPKGAPGAGTGARLLPVGPDGLGL